MHHIGWLEISWIVFSTTILIYGAIKEVYMLSHRQVGASHE